MKYLILLFISAFLFCCNSHSTKNVIDSTTTAETAKSTFKGTELTKADTPKSLADSVAEFERRIYLEIDQVYTGKTYIDKKNRNVFNRILLIPKEENIMLIAENIAFAEEGGNFQLVKLSRITDSGSVLPRFGLSSVDSLKFIDSVNIQGYFNGKRQVINLNALKAYHPKF